MQHSNGLMMLATKTITNTMSMHIYNVKHECGEEKVLSGASDGKARWRKVYYSTDGRPYFMIGKSKHYFDEFIKLYIP